MIKLILSECLEVMGLPENLEAYLEGYCNFNTSSFQGDDIPDSLHLFERTSTGSIKIPRGLLFMILNWCKKNQIPYDLKLNTAPGLSYPFQINPKINYTSGLYGYQGRVANEVLKFNTVRLEAPTGAGKTVISCLIPGILQKGPLLFLANKDRLLRQFVNTVKNVLDIPEEEVGIIKAKKRVLKPITVGSLQTLGKETFDLSELRDYFHIVMFDECHLSSAVTYRRVILGLAPQHLIGLSATPEHYSSEDLNHLMEAMLGPVGVVVREEEIPGRMNPKTVTRLTSRSYYYNIKKSDPDWKKFKARDKLYTQIAEDEVRNRMIVADCVRLVNAGYKVLITVQRVEQGRLLSAMLDQAQLPHSFPYEFKINKKGEEKSKVNHKQLDEDVIAIEEGKLHALVGTINLFSTGFDCKDLSALLLGAPFSGTNTTTVVQAVGRIQRRAFNKKFPVVLDYTDVSQPVDVLGAWAEDRADFMKSKFGNHDVYPK